MIATAFTATRPSVSQTLVSPRANFPLKYQLLSTPKYVGHLVSSPRGRTYHGSRTCYYANSDSSFQQRRLLTSGNVSLNPVPGYGTDTSASNGEKGRTARKSPRWKYPCEVCPKPVRSKQKRSLCDVCCKWHRIKCVNMDHRLYTEYGSSVETWYCTNCSLPFNFTDSFFEEPVVSDAPITDPFESNPTDDITSGRQSLSPKILVLNA